MANKLIVAPAPHVHGSESTQKIMRDVLLALTPALVFSVVAFGWSALAVTCISVASCVLFEYLIQKFLLKGPCTVSDLSAVAPPSFMGREVLSNGVYFHIYPVRRSKCSFLLYLQVA